MCIVNIFFKNEENMQNEKIIKNENRKMKKLFLIKI